ncbi:MAG TPA: diguanylate cyclase [Acidobacteriota bacterium]|nr:diguanylate cyclase [Acidobacteriota bacterium]
MRTVEIPFSTLSLRAEQQYMGLRGVIFFSLLFHILVGRVISLSGSTAGYAVIAYAATLPIPIILRRLTRWSWAKVFAPTLVVDIAVIALATHWAGGIAGNMHLLYYIIVAFVGYHMGLGAGIAVAAVVTVAYGVPCLYDSCMVVIADFIFRTAIFWLLAIATGLASRSAGVSTTRLLTAMDKLNERTTELERTHTQLQTIYENSRSLAELLAEENVISRVLTIGRSVLGYPVCEIYTWDRMAQKLWLKGRIDAQTSEQYNRPQLVPLDDTFRRVLLGGEIVRVVDRHLGRTVMDGKPHRSQLVVPMVSEGRTIGLLSAESPDVNAFGERDERVFSILAASTALALANADLHQRMEKLTIQDELTGLYNFRYFRMRLEDERRRTVRYRQPLSLIMVDIDWFKRLNDSYGHELGNLVLRQLAQAVSSCVRDVDILARYGGEEFVIILPQTGGLEASVIGERIRGKVETTTFGPAPDRTPLHLTVSIGVSCFPENGFPEDGLVESVDRALYQAKGAGKNAVRVMTPVRA